MDSARSIALRPAGTDAACAVDGTAQPCLSWPALKIGETEGADLGEKGYPQAQFERAPNRNNSA
jgi:hypothetical protein